MTCVGPCIVANYLHDWNKVRCVTVDEAKPNTRMYRDGLVTRWRPQEDPPVPQLAGHHAIGNVGDLLIACPTCRTPLSRHCQTTTGRHRADHGTRLVSRRCACGDTLPADKKMCEPCRADARRTRGPRVAA